MRYDVPGAWQTLFARAMLLIDDLSQRTGQAPFWTFGGGTVLMLQFRHRQSKDIDIFFADPQALAYVNPRNGGLAESLTTEYADSADHLKLFFMEGEIDFVASPNLTVPGFTYENIESRRIRVETAAEIIAKKMWHRGHEAKARDLFDLCVVIEDSRKHARDTLGPAKEFLLKNRSAFLRQIRERREILQTQFNEVDAMDYHRTFDACVELASKYLTSLDNMPLP